MKRTGGGSSRGKSECKAAFDRQPGLTLRDLWNCGEDQGESPKKFLRSVKVGIGESVREGKWQRIEFEDAQRRSCRVVCSGTEEVMLELVTPALEDVRLSISLTPGQAQRLANTLESWAFNGKLGGA